MSDNSWYEKGELPPVGSKCLFIGFSDEDCEDFEKAAKGQTVEIACHFKAQACMVAGFLFIGTYGEVFISQAKSILFRPIKTERELAIDAAKNSISKSYPDNFEDMLGKLFDAGLLRSKNES